MFGLNKVAGILLGICVQLALCQNNSDISNENADFDEYELIFAHVVSIFAIKKMNLSICLRLLLIFFNLFFIESFNFLHYFVNRFIVMVIAM